MTTLLNIAENNAPLSSRKLEAVLEDLNIGATVVTNSAVDNPHQLGPDVFNMEGVNSNVQRRWVALTVEEFNSLVHPEENNEVIRNLRGSARMPKFDKLIFAQTRDKG